jgi:hypothetical protein
MTGIERCVLIQLTPMDNPAFFLSTQPEFEDVPGLVHVPVVDFLHTSGPMRV